MKVETTTLENRILKVVVEATPVETETARRNAALKLGKKVRVPGFRPGKVPYPILLKHLDPILLQEETIDVFLDEVYPEILEEQKIKPYSQGRLESILEINPLKLEIHIPLHPLVEIGDYHSIRIPYDPPTVSDDEVSQALERLRQQNAVLEPVNRPIENGDIVFLDLIGFRLANGEITNDMVVERKDFSLQIRIEKQETWEYPFDGFSKELIGKQANDQFGINYSYSEDTPIPSLKGMDVHFEVTIKQVKAEILPELNDEFAQSVGEYSTLDDLRNSVYAMLIEQTKADYQEEFDKKILQEVITCSTFDYPLELFEMERNKYLEDLRKRLAQYSMDLDLYKKIRGLNEEQFEDEVKDIVDKGIKSSLALLEIAKKENVRIDPNKVRQNTQELMQDILDRSRDARIPKQMLDDFAYRISQRNMFDQVMEGALEKLRQIAKGEENTQGEKENDSEEVLKKPDGLDKEEIREPETEGINDTHNNFANEKSDLEL